MANFNLSLTPPQSEFILKPGINLVQAYQLTNNSSQTLTLNTEVLPWIPLGNEGDVSYDNVSSSPNIHFSLNNSDLKLSQNFVLRPQESRQLVLKITTDPNSQLTDYYYTFFISQVPHQSLDEENVSQAFGKIGSHILLSVSPTANPQIKSQIQNFHSIPKIKDILFTPITFQGQINNNSDYFFKSQGTLTITKGNITIKELKLAESNVLAHHSRNFSCQNQETCKLSPPFWPGSYTATLKLDPSLNAPSTSVSFFIFPFSPLIFLLFVLILFFGFKTIIKRFHHP